jgi:YVTN family beta-propeller protein
MTSIIDIDTASAAYNTVISAVDTGGRPLGVAVHPNGSRVFATNSSPSGNTVAVIDTALAETNPVFAVIAIVTVGRDPTGVTVHPDGTRVYVANCGDNNVSIIDTATNTVSGTPILVGDCPRALGQFIRSGPPNTPTGSNVVVSVATGSTVTFTTVSSAGETFLSRSESGPTSPTGFSFGDPPTYYDLTTTAGFSGSVTVCFAYNPAQFVDPSNLRIVHFENNAWAGVTTSNNTSNNTICGQVNGFSVFAIVEPTTLAALSQAKLWIGLKNSDDVGIRFDVFAEVYKGSTLVGSGQINSVAGGSSGFNNAKLDTIPLGLFVPVYFPPGSALSIKLYIRNACAGSGKNSGTARLWYNDMAANSQFGATIGAASNYYLRDGFVLATVPGPGPKKTIDVAAGAKCSPFKTFGTWSITP